MSVKYDLAGNAVYADSFNGTINGDVTGNVTVGTATITSGSAAPSASAPNGSIYLRTGGTADTTLYVRAAGAWTALTST